MDKTQMIMVGVIIVALAAVGVAGVTLLKDSGSNNGSDTADYDGSGRLWIAGNANFDDSVDQDDIDYIQAVIDKKVDAPIFNARTNATYSQNVNLADANGDGKVDADDIQQVKDMIAGTQKRIWYIDVDGMLASVHTPINKIASLYFFSSEQIAICGAWDKVVAYDVTTVNNRYFESAVTTDGATFDKNTRFEPTYAGLSQIAKDSGLDIVLTGSRAQYAKNVMNDLTGHESWEIVRIASWEDGKLIEGTLTLSYLLGAYDKGIAYANWVDEQLGKIKEKTSTLTEDQKVSVLSSKGRDSDMYQINCVGSGRYETIALAGGINAADKYCTSADYWTLTEEAIGNSGVDYIICNGYDQLKNSAQNKNWTNAMNSTYSAYFAVTGTKVHTLSDTVFYGPMYVIGAIYMAKWFYPELFADLDPLALYKDFVSKFFTDWNSTDYNLDSYNVDGGIAY